MSFVKTHFVQTVYEAHTCFVRYGTKTNTKSLKCSLLQSETQAIRALTISKNRKKRPRFHEVHIGKLRIVSRGGILIYTNKFEFVFFI